MQGEETEAGTSGTGGNPTKASQRAKERSQQGGEKGEARTLATQPLELRGGQQGPKEVAAATPWWEEAGPQFFAFGEPAPQEEVEIAFPAQGPPFSLPAARRQAGDHVEAVEVC